MSRKIRSFLLAAVAASSLPLAQPAQALLTPWWDCGIVSVRDVVNTSANTWIAAQYAVVIGVPGVHTNVRVTCWLQHARPNLGTPTSTSIGGTGVDGSFITCTGNPANLCTNAPTTYVSPPGKTTYLCLHVVWDDTVTGLTNFTVRSDPCKAYRPAYVGSAGTNQGHPGTETGIVQVPGSRVLSPRDRGAVVGQLTSDACGTSRLGCALIDQILRPL